MKSNFFLIFVTYIMLVGCGFEVMSQNYFSKYRVQEIVTSGDKRISYLLRSNLKIENKNALESLKLEIVSEKSKTIKEKNIQNEITKYEINVKTRINFNLIEKNKKGQFTLSKKGDYLVSSRYSDTLSNEKKLIKNLINELSDEIIKNLVIKLNEF